MHTGSCHCGAVKFEVDAGAGPDKVLECNCSHCSRKGLLLWFVPREALKTTAGEDQLETYTFNKKVIEHRFCPTCGVQPYSFGTMPDGTKMAAINTRCLEGFDLENVERKPINGREF